MVELGEEVIDTHVHFMAPDRFCYPWLSRRPDVDRPFADADYRAQIGDVNVKKVILVEAAATDEQSGQEASWLASFVSEQPKVSAIVAQARLERGAAVQEELDGLAEIAQVRGVRRVIRAPFQRDPDFCIRPNFVEGIRILEQYGYSFDVACGLRDLHNVVQLADRCPNVSLILNHMANPPMEPDARVEWRAAIETLAKRPNVSCKISGMPTHLPAGWDSTSVAPFVEITTAAFGSNRILFGSDTPVQTAAGGFSRWFSALSVLFASASQEDRRLFFHDNSCRIYRL